MDIIVNVNILYVIMQILYKDNIYLYLIIKDYNKEKWIK